MCFRGRWMTNSLSLETIAVIGIGLIGGSFALDVQRKKLAKNILGYDHSQENCRTALKQGIVHHSFDQYGDSLKQADLVLLAVPVQSFSSVLSQIIPFLRSGTIITDVGSVKRPLLKLMKQPQYRSLRFVGGHPIAGSEKNGPASSHGSLFEGKKFILTPDETTDRQALAKVRHIWEQIGSRIIEMDPKSHDKIFAWVSHLPHLLAYASIKAISDSDTPEILNYSGAGLKDFSRIASSSPEMWADIFLENQQYLLPTLQSFNDTIQQLQHLIKVQDRQKLLSLLENAKSARDQWVL